MIDDLLEQLGVKKIKNVAKITYRTLSEAREWIRRVLGIKFVENLTEKGVRKLEGLSSDSAAKLSKLSDAQKRKVCGCNSPCEINANRTIEEMEQDIETMTFDNMADLNIHANVAKPLTKYVYKYVYPDPGGKTLSMTWATDGMGRVKTVEGDLILPKSAGKRKGISLQTKIGNEGHDKDVGFHLVGHQFGGPINRLNVVSANGKPYHVEGVRIKNLNTGEWKKMENDWKRKLSEPGVESLPIKIEISYSEGVSMRPAAFNTKYGFDNAASEKRKFKNHSPDDPN